MARVFLVEIVGPPVRFSTRQKPFAMPTYNSTPSSLHDAASDTFPTATAFLLLLYVEGCG